MNFQIQNLKFKPDSYRVSNSIRQLTAWGLELGAWNLLLFLFLFSSCKPNLDTPELSSGEADFTRPVAIGGNYLAGYSDGALYDKGQKNSIPSLLSDRFQRVKGSDCPPPKMPDNAGLGLNSKLWESAFVSKYYLGYKTDCKDVESLSPLKELFGVNNSSAYLNRVNSAVRNMAVPFAATKDLFSPSLGISYLSGNPNPYYYRFASQPGVSTVFSDIMALDPSFAIVWVGMEDIYEYARVGGYGKTIPPASEFSKHLDSLLKPMLNNGAKGVIANIPEIRNFPFYTLIPWNGLDLTKILADTLNTVTGNLFQFKEGKNGFVIQTTMAQLGFRKMTGKEFILLTVPLDSMKCDKMGAITYIPDRYVLDENEMKNIDKAIKEYNEVILTKSVKYGFAFADMNSYFKKAVKGMRFDGVDFNTQFVSGGFFSLDGYHPNQKGYALLANEFISSINKKYNAVVPTVYCDDCEGVRFP